MFLNFFKSSAWSLGNVVACWQAFVVSQNKTRDYRRESRAARGSHLCSERRPENAGRGHPAPGFGTQKQAVVFPGHCWGAVVGLAGSLLAPFGVPLNLGIHQGFVHIGSDGGQGGFDPGTSDFHMALDFCMEQNLICYLVLDAFFSKQNSFKLANSHWSIKFRKPFVSLIVRAKRTSSPISRPGSKTRRERSP